MNHFNTRKISFCKKKKNSTKQPRIGGGSHRAAVGKSCRPLPEATKQK